MLDFKFILELLRGRNPAAIARISAFFLAPGLILGSVVSGVLGGSLGLDLERPITISQLRTEISANGIPVPKAGFALIVEPVPSEYRIQLQSAPSHLWSSLDEQAAEANRDRLTLDGSGVSGRGPLMGVSDPVTVVVEGRLGDKILLPGGAVKADNWLLPSRRSDSIVSSALLACAFAFGIALATGFPPADSNKETASQECA
jgi:hypothetical protein